MPTTGPTVGRRRIRWSIVLPIGVYLLLVISGATLSSLGAKYLRADSSQPVGAQWGEANLTRSDEYLRWTPAQLGVLATGESEHSPLAQSPALVFQLAEGGLDSLLFFDTSLLRLGPVLPDAQLFAAVRWFPLLLVALSCPVWLRRLGASAASSWLGTAALLLSPASAWWSNQSTNIMGWPLAGSVLLMFAAARWSAGRRGTSAALAAVGGVLIARCGTGYLPWVLVLAIPIVLTTVVWLVAERADRRSGLIVLGIGGLAGGAALAGAVLAHREALAALLSTWYPGRRVSTGMPLDPGRLFAAPVQFLLPDYSESLVGTNPSEFSTAYTVLLVVAVVLVVAVLVRDRGRGGRQRAALLTLTAAALAWFSWILLPWGELGSAIPIVNLVEPRRVAAVLGDLGALVCAVALGHWSSAERDERGTRTVPLAVAAVAGGLTALALPWATRQLPAISWVSGLIAVTAVTLVVWAVVRFPRRRWPVAMAAAAMTAVVITVNPLVFGLGDLRDSTAAAQLAAAGRQARADGSYWATSSIFNDALLEATGVPTLGGLQMSGPNRAAWLLLDPQAQYEQIWNRGASAISFGWVVGPQVQVASPATDQIRVLIDPCTVNARGFPLSHILSDIPLPNTCLVLESRLHWLDVDQYVYRVTT